MAKKGYQGEYKGKQELIKRFGKHGVIKIAIGQSGSDYLVMGCGELIKTVEIKTIHNKKKWYASPREVEQKKRIIEFARCHKIPAEIWIYKFFGAGKRYQKEVVTLYEPKK